MKYRIPDISSNAPFTAHLVGVQDETREEVWLGHVFFSGKANADEFARKIRDGETGVDPSCKVHQARLRFIPEEQVRKRKRPRFEDVGHWRRGSAVNA